jgi:diguanylate cyclase (GGDEF)-like protein
MSGVVQAAVAPAARPIGGLPRAAAGWLGFVVAAAGGAGASLAGAFPGETDRLTLALLLVAGGVAQARATHIAGNQVFHTGLAFTVAAALLLPPAALILFCLAQHVPEWIRQRYPWYIQTFNVSNATLSALAAWAVYHGLPIGASGPDESVRVGAAVAAAGAFVAVNHTLLAVMLRLARGHSLRTTGLFGAESLVTDLVLGAVGTLLALLAGVDPWAAPLAAVPLFLIHRALTVPSLREQARRDPKTELLNVRGLDEAAGRELARAVRFDRPLSVLVVDIDDLRGINNRHGHLVGDAALKAVATALRGSQREYDICARFGGDEFVVVLPETPAEQVAGIRDRMLEQIADDARVLHDDEEIPVRASIGAATRVATDTTVRDIIRRADLEMYAAKPGGSPAL